ncbi:hypothetical protein FSOLCH5_000534 [Fusarium solani]
MRNHHQHCTTLHHLPSIPGRARDLGARLQGCRVAERVPCLAFGLLYLAHLDFHASIHINCRSSPNNAPHHRLSEGIASVTCPAALATSDYNARLLWRPQ